MERCLNQVAWQHTHNLKFPDPRVHGQRIIANPPSMVPGYISSNGLAKELGWSHNSADYNAAKLFGACFLWEGGATNLSIVLKKQDHVWINSLLDIGVEASIIHKWVKKILDLADAQLKPSMVSIYSPQVRFLYNSNYVAITPVVSHSFMAEVERLARKRIGRFGNIKHRHPTSLGDLSGSIGGNFYILKYPPRLTRNESASLAGSGFKRLEAGESLFDSRAIFNKGFLSACRSIVRSSEISTDKIRKSERRHAISSIKSHLADWLAPIFEWKESITCLRKVPLFVYDTLEWKVSSIHFTSNTILAREVGLALNKKLSEHHNTRSLAYHPLLMRPLEAILRSLLNKYAAPQESESKECSEVAGDDKFIYLKKAKVYDASAMSTPYLSGIPSLTALWGMTKEYEINLNRILGSELRFNGVAWFLHEYQGWSETKLPAKIRRVGKQVMLPGLKPSRYCDMTMDLLIRVHDPDDELGSIDKQLLHTAFPSRFAGGTLHPSAEDSEPDCCRVERGAVLFHELQRLPRSGRWIVPESMGCDGLEQGLNFFHKFKSIRPIMAGYALLEEPVKREGALESTHAFAESLIGAARLASPVEYRLRGWRALRDEAFWGMRIENSAMLMGRV
ncbi:CRISPR-associated protein [Halomonas sp. THAF5a]|nr:CRISPR-associated protein [Halomonas sp. THAF5a]